MTKPRGVGRELLLSWLAEHWNDARPIEWQIVELAFGAARAYHAGRQGELALCLAGIVEHAERLPTGPMDGDVLRNLRKVRQHLLRDVRSMATGDAPEVTLQPT